MRITSHIFDISDRLVLNGQASLMTIPRCGVKRGVDLQLSSMQSHDKAKRFLALGDSYTIGESVAESDRWPNQLITKLNAFGGGLGNADPRQNGLDHWRTPRGNRVHTTDRAF